MHLTKNGLANEVAYEVESCYHRSFVDVYISFQWHEGQLVCFGKVNLH